MGAFKNKKDLRDFLDQKLATYNHASFIEMDPISIPHFYSKKQDIEISGLFAATFAWGNRVTIIRKSRELMKGMDDAPYDFIRHHDPSDLKRFLHFKHRTFNETDLLYFIRFLKNHYQHADTLESAFLKGPEKKGSASGTIHSFEDEPVGRALTIFNERFFSLENAPKRTYKHIASPVNNSTCKRLNMYLRWMVRKDATGVDFGIWKKISAADLICPVDLHVARVGREFGLIRRKQTDWDTAIELTKALRELDSMDPVKYDFALFGLGVAGEI